MWQIIHFGYVQRRGQEKLDRFLQSKMLYYLKQVNFYSPYRKAVPHLLFTYALSPNINMHVLFSVFHILLIELVENI